MPEWRAAALRAVASECGLRAVATRGDALRIEVSGVEVPCLVPVGTIPGVAITAAAGRNGPGVGYIRSTDDGTLLSWKAPGSRQYGDACRVQADCTGILEDGDDPEKWVRISVDYDWLQPSPSEARVYLRDLYENGVSHDDVTAGEAAAGDVADYTLTLTNDSGHGMSQVKAWSAPEISTLTISDDGVAYVVRNDETNPLALADIPAGGSISFYCRRTVSAGASADTGVLSHLHFRWEGM